MNILATFTISQPNTGILIILIPILVDAGMSNKVGASYIASMNAIALILS